MNSSCKKISFEIPYPTISRNSRRLVSLNTGLNMHRKREIRDELYKIVKLAIPKEMKCDKLKITCRILRKGKRKFDSINMAYIVKIIEDILVQLGVVKDDDKNTITLENTLLGSEKKFSKLRITIECRKD